MINIKFLHTIIEETVDNNLFKKITSEQFFSIIKKSEIDLDELANQKKKNDYIPFHRFNFILKELHEKRDIDIIDSCIYIITEMLSLKNLIGCLNDENKYLLRISLAERFHIKQKKSSLDSHVFIRKKSKK